jgi:3-oxoacyl-[acyl-carrier protein] reductase
MNVLLTGGSRGIGAASVRALHAAGANIVFTYNREAELANTLCDELGSRVYAEQCDIADGAALPALVTSCIERMGSIDVLVNNAATFDENPFFDTTYEAWRTGWQRTFDVNLFGAANLTYLVLQHMRERARGKILNIVSRAAHRGELTFADYGASKAALTNLTKSIARSCAPYGIVAIAIAPGFIETDMAAPDLETRGHEIAAEVPMGYVGKPEEVAAIVAFFASDAANYANGATIDVNGGSYVR